MRVDFARTISTEEPQSLALIEGQAHLIEQYLGADTKLDLVEADIRHEGPPEGRTV